MTRMRTAGRDLYATNVVLAQSLDVRESDTMVGISVMTLHRECKGSNDEEMT